MQKEPNLNEPTGLTNEFEQDAMIKREKTKKPPFDTIYKRVTFYVHYALYELMEELLLMKGATDRRGEKKKKKGDKTKKFNASARTYLEQTTEEHLLSYRGIYDMADNPDFIKTTFFMERTLMEKVEEKLKGVYKETKRGMYAEFIMDVMKIMILKEIEKIDRDYIETRGIYDILRSMDDVPRGFIALKPRKK